MAETEAAVTEQAETEAQKLTRENAELKAALNAANSRADTAERGQGEAQRGAMTETQRRIAAELSSCKTQIESLDAEADSIEAQIATLSDEPGHGKEIAALNRKLAENVSERREQKNRETYFTGQATKAQKDAEAPPVRLLANGNPITAFDATAQAWIEKHPACFTDKAYFNRVIAAAQAAINLEGLAQNSPEFFAYVEEKAEQRAAATQRQARTEAAEEETDSPYSQPTPAQGDDLYRVSKPQTPAAGRGSMAAVASPSRTQPGETSVGGRRVPALSADEKSVADDLYGDLAPLDRYKKYAEGKAYMASRPARHFN